MAQTRYAVRHTPTSGSLVIVFIEINGQLTQIGNPIDTSIGGGIIDVAGAVTADDERTRHTNLATKFLGGVYVWVSNAIWKLDRGTGNWTAVKIMNTAGFEQNVYYAHTGLYVSPGPSGAPRMFGLFVKKNTPNRNWYSVHTDDGAAYTETQGPVPSTNGLGLSSRNTPMKETLFRGQLFFGHNRRASFDQFMSFDPATLVFTGYAPFTNSGSGLGAFACEFINYKDRLFLVSMTASGTVEPRILELIGGNFVNETFLAPIFAAAHGDTAASWQGLSGDQDANSLVCFYDPSIVDALIFFLMYDGTVNAAAERGLRCAVYDPNSVVSTATYDAAVVPAGIRFPNHPALPGGSEEMNIEGATDNAETPGTVRHQLRFSVDKAGAVEVFEFTDLATLLNSAGSGGNYRDFSWSTSKDGGGERVYQDRTTEYDCVESGPPIAITGGQRRTFRLYSDPADASAAHELRGYFSEDGESPTSLIAPLAVGKISGPAPAPTLNVNVVEGLTADNGATEYFLDFPGPAQGVQNGEQHKVMLILTSL